MDPSPCFNPRAPRGARRPCRTSPAARRRFQSTRPARGATAEQVQHPVIHGVSIHAPRAGRDAHFSPPSSPSLLFQSTRPARGATRVWGAVLICKLVSIHAPRAGRDRLSVQHPDYRFGFNPRAPRGARRPTVRVGSLSAEFQSTRPARGATSMRIRPRPACAVSIHAPRAGRDHIQHPHRDHHAVSIHAPRAGRDIDRQLARVQLAVSIHAPRAGRDVSSCGICNRKIVSIHAPRAGRDTQ